MGIAPSPVMVSPCLLKVRMQTIFDFPPRFDCLALSLRASQEYLTELVLQKLHVSSIFFPAIFVSSTCTKRNQLFSQCINKQSHPCTFSQFSFSKMYRSVAPTAVLPMDVRLDVFQVEPQDLLFCRMILDIENVVDVSKSNSRTF